MGPKTETQKFTNSTENASSSVRPTDEQAGFLGTAFNAAEGAYNQAANNQYAGQQVAGFNPNQLNTFQNMLNYSNTSTLPQQSQEVGGEMLTKGADGSTGAIAKLMNYSPTGGVDTNIAAATKYSDNPNISGMVDAAMRDANRSVSEQALPQIARQAAASGNALSTKRAISEGIVQRGLAEKTADVSAQLRGDAYKQGLDLAEKGRQFDNSSGIEAAGQAGAIANNTSKVGALVSDNSLAQQKSIFDIANAGGAGQQAATQADIDNARQMIEYANKGDWDNAARLYAIVGDKMWGNNTTSTGTKSGSEFGTTKTDPGALAMIGGGLGAVGSLMGMPTGGGMFGKLFG